MRYYHKIKRTLREKLTLFAVLLVLLAPAVNCDAGGIKAPVARVTIQDMVDAAVALARMDQEVPNICRVEYVEVDGKWVYRESKVAAPAKTKEVEK